MSRVQITRCADFQRVDALPRRARGPEETAQIKARLDALLVRADAPHGTGLRPIQARVLAEIVDVGGGVFSGRVGIGKTLVSLLTPTVLGARCTVLVVPAKLRRKTAREWGEYARHWRVSMAIHIVSYESLGRLSFSDYLSRLAPDCLILDEAHKAKNLKAGVTRRIKRIIEEARDADRRLALLVMSGSLTKRRMTDYAHLAQWALGDRAPVPFHFPTLGAWSAATDSDAPAEDEVTEAGALKAWVTNPGWKDELQRMGLDLDAAFRVIPTVTRGALREAVKARIWSAPGCISTTDDGPPAGLEIYGWRPTVPVVVTKAIDLVDSTGELPDGQQLIDGPALYAAERTLALGFWYRWRVQPPPIWMQARRLWARYVRRVMQHHPYDTEFAVWAAVTRHEIEPPTVADWIDRNGYDDADAVLREHGTGRLDAVWRTIKGTFVPDTETVWISDYAVHAVREWLAAHPRGIAWIEHRAFGAALAALGTPYYGAGGLCGKTEIEAASGPLAASVASNSEGRNLQAWHDSLITAPMPDAGAWEQLLGRTHRDGTRAEVVTAHVARLCTGHESAMAKALDRAHYIEQSTGQAQKLLLATNAYLDDTDTD